MMAEILVGNKSVKSNKKNNGSYYYNTFSLVECFNILF